MIKTTKPFKELKKSFYLDEATQLKIEKTFIE